MISIFALYERNLIFLLSSLSWTYVSSFQVDARLKEEEFRTCKYLHATSVEKVMSVCQDKLVKSQLHLLQSECHDMIHNEKLTGMAFLCGLSTVMSCHNGSDFPLEMCF